MCTLLTVSSDAYTRAVEARIKADARDNPDGFALLLVDSLGAVTITRTLDHNVVLLLLEHTAWTRMFLHSRWATQGQVTLDNAHGWAREGVFYMHNGSIQARESALFPVDSQAIGEWLCAGVSTALSELQYEPYANVFLVDTNEEYYAVSRSDVGTLFTDGRGNYSTNKVGAVRRAVPRGTQHEHLFFQPTQRAKSNAG